MSTDSGQDLRPVSSLWWLMVLFGVVALGVGVFFVVSPHETLSTFTAIAGIFVLIDGVIAVVASIFGSGDRRGLLALIGVLSAIAGLILIKKPFETLAAADLGLPADEAGEAGSRTAVLALAEPPSRGDSVRIEDDGSAAEKVVEYLAERKLI